MAWAIKNADLGLHCQCHGWVSRKNTTSCDGQVTSTKYTDVILKQYLFMYPGQATSLAS